MKILVFEALNLPYINVGKDPYLVTFSTEPITWYFVNLLVYFDSYL